MFDRSVTRVRRAPSVLLVAALLLGATALVGGTASAAPTGQAPSDGLDVANEGCELFIDATVADAGDYIVQIWDDGSIIAELPFTADGPGETSLTYTVVAQPGEGAPGLGIVLADFEGAPLVTVDPYLVDACEVVATTTTEATTTTMDDGSTTTTAAEVTTTTAATQATTATNTPAATPTAPAAEGIAAAASYTG